MAKNDRLSIFLSLVLRHHPEAAYVEVDEHGWADTHKLIEGINKTGRYINMEILDSIVKDDAKQRYSFSDDKSLIRANQGHSIPVDVELDEIVPPDILYHGTSKNAVDNILKEGIKSMSRLYVHLSYNIETAINVGSRHGEPVVLKVSCKDMVNDNIKFYISKNGVLLTKYVDSKYIDIL